MSEIVTCQCGEQHPAGTEWCPCGRNLYFDQPESGGRTARPPVDPAHDITEPVPRVDPTRDRTVPPDEPDRPGDPAPTGHDTRRETGHGGGASARRLGAEEPEPDHDGSATPTPSPPRHTSRPDDKVCERCQARNPADRTFCRSCGHQLGAVVASSLDDDDGDRPSWFRRTIDRVRGRRTAGPGGARQKVQNAKFAAYRVKGTVGRVRGLSWRARTFRTAALAALGCGAVVAVSPGLRSSVSSQASFAFSPDNHRYVSVSSASADTVVPGWEPWLAADNSRNRAWAHALGPDPVFVVEPPPDGSCVDAPHGSLRFGFAEPVDLDRVSIWAGTSEHDDARGVRPRPRLLQLRLVDGDAPGCEFLVLEDDTERQSVGIDARNVTSVEFGILDVFPGQGGSDLVAISEVWWEQRK